MIYFGIPLRSKAVSKNWAEVTRVFNRTLRSIYNQTDPDFKIIVACHDLPELDHTYDNRVEFLQTNSPIPTSNYEMMLDKGWKVSMIAGKIREYGGGYTMIVDSDDLVSNRIAEYVNQHPGRNGFLSHYGYIYNEGYTYLKKVRAMYRICGSCSIVYYRKEDLPDRMPENLWDDSFKDQWTIRMPHRDIPGHMAETGRRLSVIPFVTTVYLRSTGDNHSMLGGNDLSRKRKVELCFRRRISLQEKLKSEFGL